MRAAAQDPCPSAEHGAWLDAQDPCRRARRAGERLGSSPTALRARPPSRPHRPSASSNCRPAAIGRACARLYLDLGCVGLRHAGGQRAACASYAGVAAACVIRTAELETTKGAAACGRPSTRRTLWQLWTTTKTRRRRGRRFGRVQATRFFVVCGMRSSPARASFHPAKESTPRSPESTSSGKRGWRGWRVEC